MSRVGSALTATTMHLPALVASDLIASPLSYPDPSLVSAPGPVTVAPVALHYQLPSSSTTESTTTSHLTMMMTIAESRLCDDLPVGVARTLGLDRVPRHMWRRRNGR